MRSETVQGRLFEGGPVSRTCLACVRVAKETRPVLCQCTFSRLQGESFCGTHVAPHSRKYGQWDVRACAVVGCADRLLEKAKADAEARARVIVDSSELIRDYDRRDGARSVRSKTEQPAFVERGDAVGSSLREFAGDGVALPPFPCMLCECDFSTRARFLEHIGDSTADWWNIVNACSGCCERPVAVCSPRNGATWWRRSPSIWFREVTTGPVAQPRASCPPRRSGGSVLTQMVIPPS